MEGPRSHFCELSRKASKSSRFGNDTAAFILECEKSNEVSNFPKLIICGDRP